jgi:hypothetical protein
VRTAVSCVVCSSAVVLFVGRPLAPSPSWSHSLPYIIPCHSSIWFGVTSYGLTASFRTCLRDSSAGCSITLRTVVMDRSPLTARIPAANSTPSNTECRGYRSTATQDIAGVDNCGTRAGQTTRNNGTDSGSGSDARWRRRRRDGSNRATDNHTAIGSATNTATATGTSSCILHGPWMISHHPRSLPLELAVGSDPAPGFLPSSGRSCATSAPIAHVSRAF